MTSPQRSDLERRWGGPKVALGAIVALAAALRLVGLEYGLPHGNLLNADEPNAVVRAWEMTHGGGPDPHPFFDYPSLFLYVLAPFESWQDQPDYRAARIVAVVIGLLGVAAAWWLGSKAYGVVAGAVGATATAVATVHVAYSRPAVADVLLTTLITASLALLVSGRIELAGLAAGPRRREVPRRRRRRSDRGRRVGPLAPARDRRRGGGRERSSSAARSRSGTSARRSAMLRASTGGRATGGSASRTTRLRRSRSPAACGTRSGRFS